MARSLASILGLADKAAERQLATWQAVLNAALSAPVLSMASWRVNEAPWPLPGSPVALVVQYRASGTTWTTVAALAQNGQRIYSTQTNVTAHVGGGQANATQLAAEFCVVATVASSADSVVLPATMQGLRVRVTNRGASTLALFPPLNSAINGGSVNASYSLAANKSADCWAVSATQWEAVTLSR